jgi:hypothetical protein
LQERAVAQILFNLAQQRIAFDFSKTNVALFVGAFEPLEG